MHCFICKKRPDEILEYVEAAAEEGITPDEYVSSEEGTYNPESQQFACTACYIKIGMPSRPYPGGRKAP